MIDERRQKAQKRLELQLISKTKKQKWEIVPLTLSDIERIEKEIQTLKSRFDSNSYSRN